MQEHTEKARQRIVSLVDNAKKEEIQLRASQDILDRMYGKPTQHTEVVARGITLNIDLSSALDD
jgi:hypothetical protein